MDAFLLGIVAGLMLISVFRFFIARDSQDAAVWGIWAIFVLLCIHVFR